MIITGGNLANFINVFSITNPEHPSSHYRHSFILVFTLTPEFEADKLHGKMSVCACDTDELFFSNVKEPLSNLIGTEGEGSHEVTKLFNRVRLMVAAMGVGVARAALEVSTINSKKLHAFGAPLPPYRQSRSIWRKWQP